MSDDHPSTASHEQCPVDHQGNGVPDHCRCGELWPCPLLEGEPPQRSWFTKLIAPHGYADPVLNQRVPRDRG